MTDLIPFDYAGQEIRTVLMDDAPWFVAADVCAVLGIVNVSDALTRLDEVNIGQADVPNANGRLRSTKVVDEAGLYELIIRSDKPEARPFRRWLTAEVIPAIRKTGSFGTAPALPDLTTVEGQLAVLDLAKKAIEGRIEAEAKVRQLQPKADYVDGFVNASTDGTLIRVLANQVGMAEKALRAFLVEHKVIYRKLEGTRYSRSAGRNVNEYSWHAHAKYSTWFVERDQPEAPRLHNGQMQTTLYATPVGKVKVADLVAKASAA